MSFALFETAIGHCGIAWGRRGVLGLQLPEPTAAATRTRMRKRFPKAVEGRPTRDVTSAMGAITRLLSGKHVELDHIELDMEGVPPFHRRAYEAARSIPPGRTMSYGEVAERVGSPNSSRAVGQAMRRNPFPIVVPCHRVLASGGKAGGFTAPGGVDTKMRMLEIEGARLAADPRHGVAEAPTRKAATAGKKAAATKAMAGTKPAAPKKKTAATNVAAGKASPAKRTPASKAPTASAAKTAPKPAPPPISAKTGLTFDPKAALRELRARDAVLAGIIDSAGPFRPGLKSTQSVFAALSEAIVYQQLTGKAAATIYGRLCALFPNAKKGFKPEHILGASDEALRGAGLSRAKVAALRDLARKTVDGELPTLARARRMHDDDLVEALTAVRGIGRWTVEMLLMFRLGRPDVLPADDYGVRKGFQIAYRRRELPSRKDLERHAEKWKPWRSVASWYMWRAVDQSKAGA